MFFEAIAIAIEAILSNKLRSFMTVLGNIVAVTSIIVVVALIQGMDETVKDAIVTRAGADSFIIDRVGLVTDPEEDEKLRRTNPFITLDDARAVERFSPYVEAVMAQAQRRGEVSYKDKSLESVMVQGVTEDYTWFTTFDAERGRLITPSEIARNRPVALIGWGTADRLFGDANPLEKSVKIVGVHFRVVGVSEKKGSFLGRSQDEFAVIPHGAYLKLFGSRQSLALMVRPIDPSVIDKAMDDAVVALRTERKLKPREKNNFGLFTSETLLGIWNRATNGIFAVLIGVVALSLVVGGIVIMNIMLMVVIERTREIGLRKALGARRRDILWQVLTESVTLSTAGGIVGIVLGYAGARIIAALTPLPAAVEPWSVGLGVVITAVVGLFFGLYPAMRAASLDPIEALHKE